MENEQNESWFYTIITLMIFLIIIILLRIVTMQVKKLFTVSQKNEEVYSLIIERADLNSDFENKYYGLELLNKQSDTIKTEKK